MVISGNFPVDINIGSLIESRMETMHISKAEFARRMQMPQSNASRILKKKRWTLPSFKLYAKSWTTISLKNSVDGKTAIQVKRAVDGQLFT